MSEFITSPAGMLTVVALSLLLMLSFFAIMKRKYVINTKVLTYSAVCLALATVLSNMTLFKMPQGGSVTMCSMLFVVLIGYFFGPIPGILAGFINGMLQLLFEPYIVHPIQLLLDYPLSFAALGLAGFFMTKKYGLYIGFAVGAFGRFLVNAFSGFIFFSDYINEPIASLIYTVQYNISYILAETVITFIIISIPAVSHAIQQIRKTVVQQVELDSTKIQYAKH